MKVRDNRICSRSLPGLLVFMLAFLHTIHGFTLPRPQNHPTKVLAETVSPPFVNEVRESGSAAPSTTTTTATTNGNSGTSGSGSTTTGSSSSNTGSSSSTRQLMGNWEELHGNYVLRPNDASAQPRALLHFLGGAIVGAVPHVSYRYMLERLAAKGFLVVATPYNLSFDHLDTCDAVIQRFEKIAPMLARQYGPVPVVGVGHSCGALLQLLITSLFPDTPRAANALLSFNNKPVKEAVPFFEEASVFLLRRHHYRSAAALDDDDATDQYTFKSSSSSSFSSGASADAASFTTLYRLWRHCSSPLPTKTAPSRAVRS